MADASEMPPWARRMTMLFVIAVVLVLFFYFFNAISTVLLGVLAATIVTCALNPIIRHIPGPRGVGAALVGLGFIAVVGALLLALSLPLAAPVQRQLHNWPQTKKSVDQLLGRWSTKLNLSKPISSDELLNDIRGFFAKDHASLLLSSVSDAVLAILLWLAFVFIGSIFLLASSRDVLLSPVLRLAPTHRRQGISEMLDVLGSRLRWWIIGTGSGMSIVFVASSIGYSISGLDFAFPLALLAGIGEIVPTVGPAIAAIVAAVFAASQSGGAVVGVVLTYASIQSLEAYLILPLIMKRAVQIHPAVTLFSVVLWAKIFGIPGLMMAIPINLAIGSAVEYLYILPREQREAQSAEDESAECRVQSAK